MIDRFLSNIEKSFNKNNFQSAIQQIFELKTNYPQSKRIEDLFKKNKLKYIKKMRISSNDIESLYLNKNQNDIKIKIDQFLKIEPNNAYLNSCLGNYYGEIGQLKQARIYHEKSILLNPYERAFYINFAETCKFLSSLDLSAKIYEFCLLLDDTDEIALLSYADICFMSRKFQKSFESYEKLIVLEKKIKGTEYRKKYCYKLIISNNFEKAQEILKELTEEKDKVDVLYYNALIEIEKKDFKKASEFIDKCLKINNNFSAGHIALAIILERKGKFKEAINNLKKVIKVEKNNDIALRNLGAIYSYIGKLDKAVIYLETAIKINPNDYETKFVLGQVQLYQKNFVEGWINFESRWLCNNFKGKFFSSSKSLLKELNKTKKIFLWSEQGVGDQIMYGSLLNEFSKMCKLLTVRIDKRLICLFEKKNPKIKFISQNDKVNEKDFDNHLSIADLGKFIRYEKKQFNNVVFPYIDTDEKFSNKIRDNLSNKHKILIGISWTSKAEMGQEKSIYYKNLIPIFKLKNTSFIDLEYNNSEEDKKNIYQMTGKKIHRINEIDYYNNILGVSSIINACDLIITCSNVNAHISGALGKKTFLLLPLGKGRLLNWSSENNTSLWYPSIKIYQQNEPEDWTTPIERVREEILNCQTY